MSLNITNSLKPNEVETLTVFVKNLQYCIKLFHMTNYGDDDAVAALRLTLQESDPTGKSVQKLEHDLDFANKFLGLMQVYGYEIVKK